MLAAGAAGASQGGALGVRHQSIKQGAHHAQERGEAHHVGAQRARREHQAPVPCRSALQFPDAR